MYQRLNITLPTETVQLIEQNVARGERSKFINEAVKSYITTTNRNKLRQRLIEGATKNATKDIGITQEWLSLDEEAWQINPQ